MNDALELTGAASPAPPGVTMPLGVAPERRHPRRMPHPTRPYLFYGATVALCATCLRRVEAKEVIEDGRVLGVVSRSDLLCVGESLPRPPFDNGSGAGLIGFLESLIGGASLRGGLDRAQTAQANHAPAAQPARIHSK